MGDKYTVKALISIGRAQKLVDEVVNHPLFENLSKHNPWWSSEHEKEDELLSDIRCQLMSLNDQICDIAGELHQEYEEEREL
jgi:hypothetical protein